VSEARITFEGDLSKTLVPTLFHRARVNSRNGVLTVRKDKMEKSIYFLESGPVFASSNILSETLTRMLLASGKISQEQHEDLLKMMVTTKKKAGEVLVELGLICSRPRRETGSQASSASSTDNTRSRRRTSSSRRSCRTRLKRKR
jgi:hypothetical protein